MLVRRWFYIMQTFCLVISCKPAFAQQLSLSQPFSPAGLYPEYTLLCQQDNKIFVLSSPITADPVLMIFNDSLRLIDQKAVSSLRNASLLAVTNKSYYTRAFAEYSYPGINIYRAVGFDSTGNVSTENDIISLNTDSASVWSFTKSPSQLFHLLYRVNRPANDSITIDFVVLDSNYSVHVTGSAGIPFSSEFDRLNPVYVDDEGRLWITIFDQPLNYKLGSDIRICCYIKGEEKLRLMQFYTKEKKPVDFLYQFSRKNNTTTLHSLYVDFFSRDVAGYLSVTIDNKTQSVSQSDFPVYAFETDLKKEMQRLTTGITRDNLMNYLKIHSVSSQDDSSFIVISALNYSEYKVNTPQQGVVATRSTSITEQNPLRTAYQRDALVRQLSGTDRRSMRARRRNGLPPTGTTASAGAEAMRLRPDLFFFPENNNDPASLLQPAAASAKKIFDKYLFWSFHKGLQPNWQQWAKKEFWPSRQFNAAYIAENDSQIAAIYYQHNKKGKPELVIETINKNTGAMTESLLPLNGNSFPLFSLPALKIKDNEYLFICLFNDPAQSGICRLSW